MCNTGYASVKAPLHYPGKVYGNGHCYEHHLIYWERFGVLPSEGEQIHHKNHNRKDNRIENLELVTIPEHGKRHIKEKKNNTTCSYCSIGFRIAPWKLKRKHHFCSRKCIGLFGFNKKFLCSSIGSMRLAVNQKVVGSSPTAGA